jgi:hypothetical protein
VNRFAISHARLMRESTDRIQLALESENPHEQIIAHRLIESTTTWVAWEAEHSVLMRQVAGSAYRSLQTTALKNAALRLIHRKALFEYLREHKVRGDMRKRIIAAFHPNRSYTEAVIAEHGVYLRKASSFLCTSHVGIDLVRDAGFDTPLEHYAALYREYFHSYCSTYFGEDGGDGADGEDGENPHATLMPLLKMELDVCRRAVLHPEVGLERWLRDSALRRRTGETTRLRVLRP